MPRAGGVYFRRMERQAEATEERGVYRSWWRRGGVHVIYAVDSRGDVLERVIALRPGVDEAIAFATAASITPDETQSPSRTAPRMMEGAPLASARVTRGVIWTDNPSVLDFVVTLTRSVASLHLAAIEFFG